MNRSLSSCPQTIIPRSPTTLYVRDGDAYREAATGEVLDRARTLIGQRFRTGAPVMTSPAKTREFLQMKLAGLDFEVFAMLVLDGRHRLIEYVELFRGTIDGASVHPREVVKSVLTLNGAAVVLVHNHPSGVAEPSHADELITHRLRDALGLIDVRLLDHLIVAGHSVVSLAERGVV